MNTNNNNNQSFYKYYDDNEDNDIVITANDLEDSIVSDIPRISSQFKTDVIAHK